MPTVWEIFLDFEQSNKNLHHTVEDTTLLMISVFAVSYFLLLKYV